MFKNDKDLIERYQLFVEKEDNKNLEDFFQEKNKQAILGKKNFKKQILTSELRSDKKNRIRKEINQNIKVEDILDIVSNIFKVSKDSIIKKQTGRQKINYPRSISMYLVQDYKDYTLQDLTELFGLNNTGSVSKSIFKAKILISKKYKKEFELIKNYLWLMERA